MLRVVSALVFLASFWLANLAIPDVDETRQLNAIVGISVNGDPDANAHSEPTALPKNVFSRSRRGPLPADGPRLPANDPAKPVDLDDPDQRRVVQISGVVPMPIGNPARAERVRRIRLARLFAKPAGEPDHKDLTEPDERTPSSSAYVEESPRIVTTAVDPDEYRGMDDGVGFDLGNGTQPPSDLIRRAILPAKAAYEPVIQGPERRRIARDLQRELRRVGCYRGRIDGAWGPESIRAMGAFNSRISADLPADDPDYVLLILVEKFDDRACGAPCVSGSAAGQGGRCAGHTTVARLDAITSAKAVPAAPPSSIVENSTRLNLKSPQAQPRPKVAGARSQLVQHVPAPTRNSRVAAVRPSKGTNNIRKARRSPSITASVTPKRHLKHRVVKSRKSSRRLASLRARKARRPTTKVRRAVKRRRASGFTSRSARFRARIRRSYLTPEGR